MSAGAYDLKIEQGEDYTPMWLINYSGTSTPKNLTGYTAQLQIRSLYYSTSTLVNLTSTNGGITLGGTAGTIQLNMTAAQTAALIPVGAPAPNPVWKKINDRPYTKAGVYDLRLFDAAGKTIPIMGGDVLVSPSVTRTP